jgi:transposase InsO family protein
LVGSVPFKSVSSEKPEAAGSTYPGYLGVQDSYHVGAIEGIGDIYQQTYIDVYSGFALVKLYDQKDSRVSADMLNSTVLPWFQQHNVVIQKVMTDRGREYIGTGKQKKHQYQVALAAIGIEYTKNDSKDPQSNDICSALHEMMRQEVYDKVLPKSKKQSISLEALQEAVDNWLKWYNSERPWNGQDQGKTPLERFEGQ